MKTIILILLFSTSILSGYSNTENCTERSASGQSDFTKQTDCQNINLKVNQTRKQEREAKSQIAAKKRAHSLFKKSSDPEKSFFAHVFGDLGKGIKITLIVLACVSALLGLVYFLLLFNSLFLYCALGVILIGGLTYLIIDNYSSSHDGKGTKVLDFLATVGTPILELLAGLITGLI